MSEISKDSEIFDSRSSKVEEVKESFVTEADEKVVLTRLPEAKSMSVYQIGSANHVYIHYLVFWEPLEAHIL